MPIFSSVRRLLLLSDEVVGRLIVLKKSFSESNRCGDLRVEEYFLPEDLDS